MNQPEGLKISINLGGRRGKEGEGRATRSVGGMGEREEDKGKVKLRHHRKYEGLDDEEIKKVRKASA